MCANKLDNFYEMDKFPKREMLSKVTKEAIEKSQYN